MNKLSKELNTTKTDIVEKALKLFAKTKQKEGNSLLQFAGILKDNEAQKMLKCIKEDKNSKEIIQNFCMEFITQIKFLKIKKKFYHF